MKQRVKLAQALVHDPRLLLLDEPTNGLDPAGRDEMLELILRTGREFGIAVIVASHLLGEIERVCDFLVAIEGGKLLRAAPLGDFTERTGRSRWRSRTAAMRSRRASPRPGSPRSSTAGPSSSRSMARRCTTSSATRSWTSASRSSASSSGGTASRTCSVTRRRAAPPLHHLQRLLRLPRQARQPGRRHDRTHARRQPDRLDLRPRLSRLHGAPAGSRLRDPSLFTHSLRTTYGLGRTTRAKLAPWFLWSSRACRRSRSSPRSCSWPNSAGRSARSSARTRRSATTRCSRS